MMSLPINNVFKIIILGDSNVGKTTLRHRYLGKGFQKQYVATIGSDFALADHKDYVMQIWDLAGDESFRNVIKSMYIGAEGVILVFDVINRESMLNIPYWIESLHPIITEPIPIAIFANKIDLRDEKTSIIGTEEIMDYINQISTRYENEIKLIETSALTGENIKPAFEDLIDRVVARAFD